MFNSPLQEQLALQTRRQFLGRSGLGLGMAALAELTGMPTAQASAEGLSGLPHFTPRAKRVIYLMQSGAPSHVDLFDLKPLLAEKRGEEIPCLSAHGPTEFDDDRREGPTLFGRTGTDSPARTMRCAGVGLLALHSRDCSMTCAL